MGIDELEYIALANANDISEQVINNFDCGNQDITEYLHSQAKKDAASGDGVTYVLVSSDRKRIYAYATIRTNGLYYHDEAAKYYTEPTFEDGTILVSLPVVEIKMFAISKKLQHTVAYTMDPINLRHYSTLFFKLLLEKLYYMSMNTIGFKAIFLRSNDEGEQLYKNNLFVECEDYLDTFDAMAEGCTPLILTFEDLEKIVFA